MVIELTPSNLLHCVYLTINRIAPDYEGLELGIGEGLLVKAIAESSGRSVAQVKSELEKTGDLGDIAQVCSPYIPSLSYFWVFCFVLLSLVQVREFESCM